MDQLHTFCIFICVKRFFHLTTYTKCVTNRLLRLTIHKNFTTTNVYPKTFFSFSSSSTTHRNTYLPHKNRAQPIHLLFLLLSPFLAKKSGRVSATGRDWRTGNRSSPSSSQSRGIEIRLAIGDFPSARGTCALFYIYVCVTKHAAAAGETKWI